MDERLVFWQYAGTDGSLERQLSYIANHQGSIIGLIDQATAGDYTAGEVTRLTYDAYGVPGQPEDGQPFRYTGRRYDPETGLYYYRARYYSSTLGRFLQVDPIGYEDNMNLYGYTNNDPVNMTDPSGLCAGSRLCEFKAKVYAERAAATEEARSAIVDAQNSTDIDDYPRTELSLQEKMDAHAKDALNTYNPTSVADDEEYAGLIYQDADGNVQSTPGVPGGAWNGQPCGSNPWEAARYVPAGSTVLADWHTHGAYNPSQPNISYEYFSFGDVKGINNDASRYSNYVGGYLGTPNGNAFFYRGGTLPTSSYHTAAIKNAQRFVGKIGN